MVVAKPMKHSELVKRLRDAGFVMTRGKGDHEKWSHPHLSRPIVITDTREVSPGVTRNALKAIDQAKGTQK